MSPDSPLRDSSPRLQPTATIDDLPVDIWLVIGDHLPSSDKSHLVLRSNFFRQRFSTHKIEDMLDFYTLPKLPEHYLLSPYDAAYHSYYVFPLDCLVGKRRERVISRRLAKDKVKCPFAPYAYTQYMRVRKELGAWVFAPKSNCWYWTENRTRHMYSTLRNDPAAQKDFRHGRD